MKHVNLKKSFLSKQTERNHKARKNGKNSIVNDKESDLLTDRSFFSSEKKKKIYYLRDMLYSSKNKLESYQSNIQELVDSNINKLLNENQYDIIPFNTSMKENSNAVFDSQTRVGKNFKEIIEPLVTKNKPKNRTIIPRLTLEEIDTYYNELYQTNSTNSYSSSRNQPAKNINQVSLLTPHCSLHQTEANSQIKLTSKLKKISTRVIMKDQSPLKPEEHMSLIKDNTNPPKDNEIQSIKKHNKISIDRNINKQLSLSLSHNNTNNKPNSFIKSKNNNYKLKESLKSIRLRLQNHTNTLVNKCIENQNDQNKIAELENTKKSFYSKQIIEKIKIINNFIATQSEDKFNGTKLRHRKIFVIIDGQVILTETKIDGAYIEIATQRYFTFLETQKERMEKYFEFLSECQRVFNKNIPFKNVFLLNGTNIFDLNEIPRNDKAIYVSMSTIFRGVHLFNKKTINIKDADYDLLRFDDNRPNRKTANKTKTTKRLFLRKKNKEKVPSLAKRFKTIIKKKRFIEEQSFTFGKDVNELEKEEFVYYSDNETRIKSHETEFGLKYKTLIDQILYFSENDQKERIKELKKKEQNKLKKKLTLRVNEETKEGLDQLLIKYNVDRGKKYNINMNHQKKLIEKQNQEEELNKATRGMGIQLLRQLRIFREYKDINIILDEKEFYKKEFESDPIESIINRNIKRTYDITPLADRDIQRYFPDLVSLNIPRVLKTFPNLKRREFYEIFIQYKLLLMICVCIGRNLKLVNKGIDFNTFFHCNPPIKSQGSYIAQKIFNTLNVLDMKYINWEEYMKGMLKMKSKSLADKMDMFFKVIDADSNGLLSFEEVYNLSVTSLSRSLGTVEDDEVIQILAEYFSTLIFQLVDLPIDEGIPYALIKNTIIEGKSAASYLEMFICADNFL